jgi:hypothetical protein
VVFLENIHFLSVGPDDFHFSSIDLGDKKSPPCFHGCFLGFLDNHHGCPFDDSSILVYSDLSNGPQMASTQMVED